MTQRAIVIRFEFPLGFEPGGQMLPGLDDFQAGYALRYSLSTLSAHSTSLTSVATVANDAFLPSKSLSESPRALEHVLHTWIGMRWLMVCAMVCASGGHPTGTTASATA